MNFRAIAIKNINRRKGKMILVVSGLVVAVATAVAVLSIVLSFRDSIAAELDKYGYNVIVAPTTSQLSITYGDMTISEFATSSGKPLSDAQVSAFKAGPAAPFLRVVSPKILQEVELKGTKGLLVGMDFGSERKAKREWWILDSGEWPANDNDVLLGEGVADKLGIEAGEMIALSGRTFKVAGILLRSGSQDDSVIMGDFDHVRKVFDRGSEVSLLEVAADRSENAKTVASAARRAMPQAAVSTLIKSVEYKQNAMGLLVKFGLAVTAVVTFISLLVVFTTMASSVNERRVEIGVFRAVGYRRQNVAAIILTEALLLAVGGAVGGFMLGLGIAGLFQYLSSSDALSLAANTGLLAMSVAMSVLISVVASLIPAYRAANLDPVEALKSL